MNLAKNILIAALVGLIVTLVWLKSDNEETLVIDVSHHQGNIDWQIVAENDSIGGVVLKASEGTSHVDSRFHQNFLATRKYSLKTGIYHFYNPNRNSTEQAEHFLRTIDNCFGDYFLALDVEKEPNPGIQTTEKMITGVKNFLRIIEERTGKRPIVYSGLSFYKDNLQARLDGYDVWLAAYSKATWTEADSLSIMHQFSEKYYIPGIAGEVDANRVSRKTFDTLLASN
jgi:lysozyme